jgi:uncharacterized protein (TIGR02246 family)
MRRVVCWGAFALAVAVPAYLAGQHSVSPDYQKVMTAFTEAYNKGDAAAIGAIYAQDALRVAPDGSLHSGRAAVQQDYGASLGGPNKGASIKLTATESRQLTPDIQVVVGTWEVSGVQGGPVSGKYLNTLVRRDGRWQIVGNMAMRPAPPPQQPAR